MKRQRHTPSEIAAKLAMADEMAAQGQLHGNIARSLGISVMTYHRWRKARRLARSASKPAPEIAALPEQEQTIQIRELRQENQRLRRLVADLLLEKDKLEEGLRAGFSDRRTAHS